MKLARASAIYPHSSNQYGEALAENEANTMAHRKNTALEILSQADCPIHGFCAGIGTGGTITGIGEIVSTRKTLPDGTETHGFEYVASHFSYFVALCFF